MRIVTILLGLAMVGLAAIVIVPQLGDGDGTPIGLTHVRRGDLDWTVRAEGRVEAAREADPAFGTTGRLVEILVARGDHVREGDVIARLDRSSLLASKREAELAVEAARASLARLQSGPRPEAVDAAKARVERALAEEVHAVAEHERNADLYAQKAIKRDVFERSELDLHRARTFVEETQKELALVAAGPRVEEIAEARIAIRRDEARVDSIDREIDRTELRAPFDGQITFLYLEPGEIATPSRPVVTVSDLSRLEAVLDVDEYDVAGLEVGQPAEITFRAFAGRAIQAEVTEVGQVVGRRRGRGDDPTVIYDSRVLQVRVDLGSPKGLRPGVGLDGMIAVMRRQDVLLVPIAAVRHGPDGAHLHLNGEWTSVGLGSRDRRDVEILDGAAEGDVVRYGALLD